MAIKDVLKSKFNDKNIMKQTADYAIYDDSKFAIVGYIELTMESAIELNTENMKKNDPIRYIRL